MNFPNVPIAPGVPPLRRDPLASIPAIILLAGDFVSLLGFSQTAWGIYLNGNPVITTAGIPILQGLGTLIPALSAAPVSIAAFDYKQDWHISNYPVEDGGFQNYNKVQLPFDVRLRLATGGSVSDRQNLLDAVDAAANSLNLYDVVTPERIYLGCNISHYDLHRTAESGLGLMVIDVWFEEIRVTSTATFTTTKVPTGANPIGNGNQQPAPPSAQETSWLQGNQIT